MPQCLVGVGSNLGDRKANLQRALTALSADAQVLAVSDWYCNPAVGGDTPQGEFINGVWRVEFDGEAIGFARQLHRIENELGRSRDKRWDARSLDMDLLLVEDQVIESPELTVPHPRMITRRFVLEPAQQVAADWVHPLTGWTLMRHYEQLSVFPWFLLVGQQRQMLKELARAVAERASVHLWPEPSGELAGCSVESAGRFGPHRLDDRETRPVLSLVAADDGWSTLAHVFTGMHVPKAILVTESRRDPLTLRLLEEVGGRSPVVHLSPQWSHAVQDVVGTVEAMN